MDPSQLMLYALATGQFPIELFSQLTQQNSATDPQNSQSPPNSDNNQNQQNNNNSSSQHPTNQQNNPEMQISDIINQAGTQTFQNYIAHLMYNSQIGDFMNNAMKVPSIRFCLCFILSFSLSI